MIHNDVFFIIIFFNRHFLKTNLPLKLVKHWNFITNSTISEKLHNHRKNGLRQSNQFFPHMQITIIENVQSNQKLQLSQLFFKTTPFFNSPYAIALQFSDLHCVREIVTFSHDRFYDRSKSESNK